MSRVIIFEALYRVTRWGLATRLGRSGTVLPLRRAR